MKLVDRMEVEGTDPAIYMGHRPYRTADGKGAVSATWYAQYNYEGKTHYEPLKETNKSAAIRAAHRIGERLTRGENRPILRKIEWTELRDRYLELTKNRGRATTTLTKYKNGLDSLLEFASIEGIAKPANFSAEDFWKFNGHLIGAVKGAKTIYDRLMFVKQLFKWAHLKAKVLQENRLVSENPDKPPPNEQPCFTPDQLRTILKDASVDDRPVFAVMAYTGMRFGEVRDLQWSDLHFEKGRHGQIFIKRGGSGQTTKGKANRVIPIQAELRKILNEVSRRGDRLFYEPANSLRDPTAIVPLVERKLLARLKALCGACRFDAPKKFKLHTFRHAFASMCAMNNTSYRYALEWMGHKSSEILDLYYTMYDDVADDAMAKISFNTTAPPKAA